MEHTFVVHVTCETGDVDPTDLIETVETTIGLPRLRGPISVRCVDVFAAPRPEDQASWYVYLVDGKAATGTIDDYAAAYHAAEHDGPAVSSMVWTWAPTIDSPDLWQPHLVRIETGPSAAAGFERHTIHIGDEVAVVTLDDQR